MMTPALFTLIASILAAAPPIVIDGGFVDWEDVAVIVKDRADAKDAPLDLRTVRVSHDDRFVHIQFDVTREVNLQRLDGRIEVLFETDNNSSNGRTVHDMRGVDLIVELSPRDRKNPRRSGLGAAISFPLGEPSGESPQMSPYLVGLKIAPTYANDVFEMRIERGVDLPGVQPLFTSESFLCQLVYLDREDGIVDKTKVFAYDLDPVDPVPSNQPTDPLRRPAGTRLRVVTWNVGMTGLQASPDNFRRVLSALNPDVILFQELTEDDDPKRLARSLRDWTLSGEGPRWRVLVGSGGGRLRCAVASRMELDRFAAMDPLPMPDRADRSVRVMGAELTVAQRKLLVVSVHLRCCGYAGSFEDRTRIVEADAIRRAIADAVATGDFDGVIVGGDLNLVGSRWPLDVLTENLRVVEALQLDGRSNTTWGDIRQPFLPGRLDFVLLSATSPEVRGSFVLDTRVLEPQWGLRHGLVVDDTVEASDHSPVVVDLGWTDRPGG